MYSNGKQKENENNRSNNSLDLDMIKNLINNSVPNRIQGFNIGQLPPPPMLNIPKTPAVPAPVRLNNAQEQQPIPNIELIQELENLLNANPQAAPAINDWQLEQLQQEQEETQEKEGHEDILANLRRS